LTISHIANIHWIDGYISAEDLYRMIELSDCYISLHRSEGLGLGMAEAMKLGTLVIATAYSGNLSFMNKENSLLVSYSKVEVKKNEYPYAGENYWAEPDIKDASMQMKLAYKNKALRERLVKQAKLDMDKYTSANQRIWIEDRLKKIQ
jgi:glycosyltransferase involved in cell wall biosynthesis